MLKIINVIFLKFRPKKNPRLNSRSSNFLTNSNWRANNIRLKKLRSLWLINRNERLKSFKGKKQRLMLKGTSLFRGINGLLFKLCYQMICNLRLKLSHHCLSSLTADRMLGKFLISFANNSLCNWWLTLKMLRRLKSKCLQMKAKSHSKQNYKTSTNKSLVLNKVIKLNFQDELINQNFLKSSSSKLNLIFSASIPSCLMVEDKVFCSPVYWLKGYLATTSCRSSWTLPP